MPALHFTHPRTSLHAPPPPKPSPVPVANALPPLGRRDGQEITGTEALRLLYAGGVLSPEGARAMGVKTEGNHDD